MTRVKPNESSDVRLVTKSGCSKLRAVGIKGWRTHFVYDFFTTMVDIKWRWNILIFVSGFIITWLIFALYYWLAGNFHGDYEDVKDDWTPCIQNVQSFVSAYLFSIETQTTIGYGSRYVTEECPFAYLVVLLQSVIGAALQTALAGLVIAKTRRAKRNAQWVLFSNTACIMLEDGQLKLVIRVCDTRKSPTIGAHLRGLVFKKVITSSGKSSPVQFYPLVFTSEGGNPQLFLSWPSQAVHVIDSKSPFWNISKHDLEEENFELVVYLEGTVATTSMPFHAKTSYLPTDILWGYRFDSLFPVLDSEGHHSVNLDDFNLTYEVRTPEVSACGLQKLRNSSQTFEFSTHQRAENLKRRTSNSFNEVDESDIAIISKPYYGEEQVVKRRAMSPTELYL